MLRDRPPVGFGGALTDTGVADQQELEIGGRLRRWVGAHGGRRVHSRSLVSGCRLETDKRVARLLSTGNRVRPGALIPHVISVPLNHRSRSPKPHCRNASVIHGTNSGPRVRVRVARFGSRAVNSTVGLAVEVAPRSYHRYICICGPSTDLWI